MRAHVIEDGIIVNTVEVESLDIIPNLISAENGGTIGQLWDGTNYMYPPSTTKPLSQKDYVEAITKFLDAGACKKNYDNIINAALRAGFSGPFHDEGVKYAEWMDQCWSKGYALLAQVESGEISQPSIESMLSCLPVCPF